MKGRLLVSIFEHVSSTCCIGDDIGIASMSSLELCNLSTIKAASYSLGMIRMHDISSRTSMFYRLECNLSHH